MWMKTASTSLCTATRSTAPSSSRGASQDQGELPLIGPCTFPAPFPVHPHPSYTIAYTDARFAARCPRSLSRRFMQDFLAGGAAGEGYYTELQSGVTPTQQQVFTIPASSTIAFTEYFKPYRRNASTPLSTEYANATAEVGAWWSSDAGVPPAKVSAMEAFFHEHEDQPVLRSQLLSQGSPWGHLHERLTGKKLAPGATFFAPSRAESERGSGGGGGGDGSGGAGAGGEGGGGGEGGEGGGGTENVGIRDDEASIWLELIDRGTFSTATLSGLRAPLAYAVDQTWVATLEASAAQHGSTWLHKLLLATAYAEAGEVDRPVALLHAASAQHPGGRSPLVWRNLAVLCPTAELAWPHFERAWNETRTPAPPLESRNVTHRLHQNVGDEILQFLIGQLPGAATGTMSKAERHSVWLRRLMAIAAEVEAVVGPRGSDTILLARLVLDVADGAYARAMATLTSECFPTLGRGRDVLLSLWRACAVGRAAAAKGQPLTPLEAHRARKASPIPRNIGCPYATLYCENYW